MYFDFQVYIANCLNTTVQSDVHLHREMIKTFNLVNTFISSHSYVCVCVTFSLSTDGHVGGSCNMAIENNAAKNMGVQIFL
jgi:hypothetical protein